MTETELAAVRGEQTQTQTRVRDVNVGRAVIVIVVVMTAMSGLFLGAWTRAGGRFHLDLVLAIGGVAGVVGLMSLVLGLFMDAGRKRDVS